jgi:hypothetical protein
VSTSWSVATSSSCVVILVTPEALRESACSHEGLTVV